jgi:hypothetical protein
VNVIVSLSVGSISATIDATGVAPDTLDEMTTRAVVLVRSLVGEADLALAARQPVSYIDTDEDDD